jgi:putative FmdB family regulatory protein
MPLYDYRCPNCDARFEAQHSMKADAPPCPECGYAGVQRVITSAPSVAGGILTHAGDASGATKEQLQDKWSEETPKLRKKLVDKLGEKTVRENAPHLFKGSGNQ